MSLTPYPPSHGEIMRAPRLNEAQWKCRDCKERLTQYKLYVIQQTHGAIVLWHSNEDGEICGPVELRNNPNGQS